MIDLGWLVLDPNIVYLILIFGLWLMITAVYVPGTGFVEALAAVALIATVILLASTSQTNWWALLLVIVGVLGFMLLPFTKDRRVQLAAIAGLGLQAAGGLFLFSTARVEPLLIALTVALPLLYHLYVLLPIMNNLRDMERTAPVNGNVNTLLIGANGRVEQALRGAARPTGTVLVRSELWTAFSDEELASGTPVTVVDVEGVQLYVEPTKQKRRETEDVQPDEAAHPDASLP